jgi:hypothetical protein
MKSPYGIPCVENCLSCELRPDSFFCSLPKESLEAFNQVKHAAVYPAGAVIFVEGQTARGIFVTLHLLRILCRKRNVAFGAENQAESSKGRNVVINDKDCAHTAPFRCDLNRPCESGSRLVGCETWQLWIFRDMGFVPRKRKLFNEGMFVFFGRLSILVSPDGFDLRTSR